MTIHQWWTSLTPNQIFVGTFLILVGMMFLAFGVSTLKPKVYSGKEITTGINNVAFGEAHNVWYGWEVVTQDEFYKTIKENNLVFHHINKAYGERRVYWGNRDNFKMPSAVQREFRDNTVTYLIRRANYILGEHFKHAENISTENPNVQVGK